MISDTAIVLTLLVLCYAVFSGLITRWYLAPAPIFVLPKMMLGLFGVNVIESGPHAESFNTLAQLALRVILSNLAVGLDVAVVVRRRGVTFRLLVIGVPLAIAPGIGTAGWMVWVVRKEVSGRGPVTRRMPTH